MICYLLIWEFVVMLESGMDSVNSTPTGWTISHPNEEKNTWLSNKEKNDVGIIFHIGWGKTSITVKSYWWTSFVQFWQNWKHFFFQWNSFSHDDYENLHSKWFARAIPILGQLRKPRSLDLCPPEATNRCRNKHAAIDDISIFLTFLKET